MDIDLNTCTDLYMKHKIYKKMRALSRQRYGKEYNYKYIFFYY